jgi:hypothetical protein
MKIEVTAEHIRNGERFHSLKCALALAIRARVGSGIYVVVSYRKCWLNGREIALPTKAKIFVLQHDFRLRVKPFTFELPIEAAEAT